MKTDQRAFIYLPNWMTSLMIACCFVGFIAIIVGLVAAVVWIVNHIRFL